MILGMSVATFTLLHVIISLVAIATGIVVMFGMWGAKRMPAMTAVFLITTVLTSVTGYFFPAKAILPSHNCRRALAGHSRHLATRHLRLSPGRPLARGYTSSRRSLLST